MIDFGLLEFMRRGQVASAAAAQVIEDFTTRGGAHMGGVAGTVKDVTVRTSKKARTLTVVLALTSRRDAGVAMTAFDSLAGTEVVLNMEPTQTSLPLGGEVAPPAPEPRAGRFPAQPPRRRRPPA